MKTKYLCPKAFRTLNTSEQKCLYISRIARLSHTGKFSAAESQTVAKMVSYSTKVVELIDEECGEVLDEAKEKMNIDSVSVFETLFKDYLSIGPLRTR